MSDRRHSPIGSSVTIEELSANPHPLLARLREHEPVSWIPAFDGWMVTRRDLCIRVMGDAETFTVDDPRFSTAQVIGPSMLSLDGIAHQRHRQPFVDPFRSAEVRVRFSDWTRDRAGELVREIAPLGSGDLRAGIAAPLSVVVMARVLDLEGVGVAELLGWYEAIVASVHDVTAGGDVPEAGRAAFRSLNTAVTANMVDSALLASVQTGRTLSIDEIVSNVAVLLFGGIVTSESNTATVLQHLLRYPEALREVRADRSLVASAVEEAMRLEPAAAVVDRYATRPVELSGASIGRGDLVRVSLAAANRDPALFVDPNRFDVHRDNAQQHLAFARGPHACLGIHLARVEARAAVDAVLDQLHDLQPDPFPVQETDGLIFRAPPTVHVRWAVR